MDEEENSKSRQLWDHLAHLIKCLYRSTDKDFSGSNCFVSLQRRSFSPCRKSILRRHFQSETIREKVRRNEMFSANEKQNVLFVFRLTKFNPQSLFIKLESIALEYVREIRKQVFERFQTCSKTSHDVQLFITYLLDEYQMFVQTATNVSKILSYLVRCEEKDEVRRLEFESIRLGRKLSEKLSFDLVAVQQTFVRRIDLHGPKDSSLDEHDDRSVTTGDRRGNADR